MKQKRTYVTLLLVLAILGLGIAYAAITSQTLTISGSAEVANDDVEVNVVFTDEVNITGAPEYATVSAEAVDGKITANINVEDFKTIGDSVTVVYTIENRQADLTATLETPEITLTGAGKEEGTESGWFDVDCVLGTNSLAKYGDEGDSTTATVTVTLNQTPVTAEQVSAASDTIKIEIVANPDETSLTTN